MFQLLSSWPCAFYFFLPTQSFVSDTLSVALCVLSAKYVNMFQLLSSWPCAFYFFLPTQSFVSDTLSVALCVLSLAIHSAFLLDGKTWSQRSHTFCPICTAVLNCGHIVVGGMLTQNPQSHTSPMTKWLPISQVVSSLHRHAPQWTHPSSLYAHASVLLLMLFQGENVCTIATHITGKSLYIALQRSIFRKNPTYISIFTRRTTCCVLRKMTRELSYGMTNTHSYTQSKYRNHRSMRAEG
jgi:hypothetical protein